MDIMQQRKAFSLVHDLFVRGLPSVSRIPYLPSKTVCCEYADNYFPRATPESRGISSERIAAMLEEFEHSRRVNMHAITVVADGAVIAEASVAPYDRRVPHVTHSLAKSITGIAVGMLIAEGGLALDAPIYRYFAKGQIPARISAKMRSLTVRHLLTMTSGVTFNETGSATDVNWVRAYFSSTVEGEPGTRFAYNSMNTYILAAAIRAVTGMGLSDYLRPRLFEPLSIRRFFWEKCPMGCEKGGWGLYLAQEDIAKIAKMMMDGGVFGERRILPESYVREATYTQIETPYDSGAYDYGYQIWASRTSNNFLFNGMMGQNAWVSPKNRIIVVTNAGNNEFFQQSSMLSIIEKYLGGDFERSAMLPKNESALRHLRKEEKHFFETRLWTKPLPIPRWPYRLWHRLRHLPTEPLPKQCRKLAGRHYTFPENNCGILPLFIRLIQNNHSAGLRGISFSAVGDRFYVSFDEGRDALYRAEIGFYRYAHTVWNISGELYRVAICGSFAVNEEGGRLLMMDIVFPEISHTRRVKFFFDDEGVSLSMREVPGREVVEGLLSSLPITAPRTRGIVSFIRNRINLDYIMLKVYAKFEPSLPAALDGEEPHTDIRNTLEKLLPAGEEDMLPEAEEES